MKGRTLFLATLLIPLAFQAVAVDNIDDVARAATRRKTTTTQNAPRGKQQNNTPPSATISRSNANIESAIKSTSGTRERAQSVVARTPATTSDAARSTTARTATQIAPRNNTVVSRTANTYDTIRSTSARTANIGISNERKITPTRTTPSISRTSISRKKNTGARSATTDNDTYQSVTSRDYKKCRDIFYNCMDEFCATKDTLLKRCACSSRVNEFDSIKERMKRVDEKLLDFSQRLLTVNMDAEDAMALNTPTAGELAYNQDDKSESKKMLDEIAKKLNTTFEDTSFNQGLNAISLSLNTDAAFDNIDSLLGASTTTKTGTDLYAAALPICREMVLEVCSDEDLAITESGYQMSIEQDCNTVAKSYQTQTEQARQKVFESGALLDMSRLDIHQKRNSDDILTCKQKMLDMLSDNSVCGPNMMKCLDTTGRYIDPTTGEAFLTNDLHQLSTLISRPETNQTWTNAPGNERFVSFLNTKKLFLEPAMENCQDISDTIWNDFVEDALAQIKLAQDKKLEEIRQSCTTLTFQCIDQSMDSLTEFDARALSIFGVSAIKTATEMCNGIRTACTTLLNNTDIGTPPSGTESSWSSGVSGVISDKTYETILSTCRTVGQNCIIQSCKSVSGNFALCENTVSSTNRSSIIDRTACWSEVLDCVASAGNKFFDEYNDKITWDTIKTKLYSDSTFTPYKTKCENNDKQCLLAEQIWGHCEISDNNLNIIDNSDNKDNETLLSWFARNTNTGSQKNNCTSSNYPFTTEGTKCNIDNKIDVTQNITNCCKNLYDYACCSESNTSHTEKKYSFCISSDSLKWIGTYNGGFLYCMGENISKTNPDENFPSGKKIECEGTILYIQEPKEESHNIHRTPSCEKNNKTDGVCAKNFYYSAPNTECVYSTTIGKWVTASGNICVTPKKWQIKYE